MPSKEQLVETLCDLPGSCLRQISGDGWPSVVEVTVGDQQVEVDLYIGLIGDGGREKRADAERRFQNRTGAAIEQTGRPILLLGYLESDPVVLVAMEADHRLGKTTRQSMWVRVAQLEQTESSGWSVQTNTVGEIIHSFWYQLLPLYVSSLLYGEDLQPEELEQVIEVLEPDNQTGDQDRDVERARRTTEQIIRDHRFRGSVLSAFGDACAFCGMNLNLLEAAHIYPASARGSSDNVSNGLALCSNHHAAFDKHLIYVDPLDLAIRFHPDVIELSADNEATQAFIEVTFDELTCPSEVSREEQQAWLEQRYEYFEDAYGWTSPTQATLQLDP